MSDDQSVHALLGPYIVDAVTDQERAAFERHLARCSDCSCEVASLREVSATMADAEAIAPPETLRADVMARIAVTPQLTPGDAGEAGDDVVAETAHTAASEGAPEHASVAATADIASRTGGRSASRALRRPAHRWLPLSAAAASVVVVVAVGLGLLRPTTDPGETAAMERDVMMIVSAPDAHTMDLDLGTTHVVVSDRMEGVAVMCSDTPMPEDGMEYQLWLVMDDGSTMAGPTFMPDDSGEVMTMMHASLDDVAAIAVTEEPKGGSEEPTSDALATTGM
ncbi:anti-sigma factor [Demequina sp. NBRC 110054]|uniref:anti-sigma factor n=1 Tax=Demequina sp. NBRC 110054 TaxID=1570343 RepID=UPI000A03789A|nr:anti-sigma factor [Demequina sp. NBRC 110054]